MRKKMTMTLEIRGVTVLGLLFCSALSHSGPVSIIINNARGTDLTRRITQLTSSPLFSQAMALLNWGIRRGVCVCARPCVGACAQARARMRACVRACVCACVRACVR